MDRPLQLRLSSSRIGQRYCIGVLMLCWLSIALAAMPLWLQAALMFAAGVATWRAWRGIRYPAVVALGWHEDLWYLEEQDAETAVTLLPVFFLAFGMISLQFISPDGAKRRLWLWPDSSNTESLRQLRYRLLQT